MGIISTFLYLRVNKSQPKQTIKTGSLFSYTQKQKRGGEVSKIDWIAIKNEYINTSYRKLAEK